MTHEPPALTGLRSEVVLSLIGNTPLVPLRFEPEGATNYAKCEFLNPSGSIKDRLAKTILVDAQGRGFGLLVGTSSGANLAAALVLARERGPSARIVTMLCDRAERYFSTRLFRESASSNSSPPSSVT